MRLSRQGYGDIELISNLDVERFMNLVHYENYLQKYDNVLNALNKKH